MLVQSTSETLLGRNQLTKKYMVCCMSHHLCTGWWPEWPELNWLSLCLFLTSHFDCWNLFLIAYLCLACLVLSPHFPLEMVHCTLHVISGENPVLIGHHFLLWSFYGGFFSGYEYKSYISCALSEWHQAKTWSCTKCREMNHWALHFTTNGESPILIGHHSSLRPFYGWISHQPALNCHHVHPVLVGFTKPLWEQVSWSNWNWLILLLELLRNCPWACQLGFFAIPNMENSWLTLAPIDTCALVCYLLPIGDVIVLSHHDILV